MQLYFVRHAQSSNNALWNQTGSDRERVEDPGLTQVGLQQARHLADAFHHGSQKDNQPDRESNPSGFGITHLYTSLMVRAVLTGTPIAERLDLPLQALPELHERGGIYLMDPSTGERRTLAGNSSQYFADHFPALVLPPDMPEDGWWNYRPYEERAACLHRAKVLLELLVERHGNTEDRVAVVSHAGFYNDFLRTLIGLENQNRVWFTLYNAAFTRMEFHKEGVEIVYQNQIEHLPAELIT